MQVRLNIIHADCYICFRPLRKVLLLWLLQLIVQILNLEKSFTYCHSQRSQKSLTFKPYLGVYTRSQQHLYKCDVFGVEFNLTSQSRFHFRQTLRACPNTTSGMLYIFRSFFFNRHSFLFACNRAVNIFSRQDYILPRFINSYKINIIADSLFEL